MPSYKAPLEDVGFLLNDVFQFDRYNNLPGFSDASADVREAILQEAAKLSEQVLQPLNRVGDLEGCVRHDDASVTTPQDEDAKAEVSSGQPKRQPAKESKSDRPQKQASMPKRERNSQGDSKRRSQKKPESAAADAAAQQPESAAHGEVSAFALAHVLGRQLLKVVPTPMALSKIKEQQTQINSIALVALNQLGSALSGVFGNLSQLAMGLVAQFVPAAASATAGQTALNVAMDANPILLVISLIGMLVGALLNFSGKNKDVANAFQNVWAGV